VLGPAEEVEGGGLVGGGHVREWKVCQ
jgi:hypothetical protein